MSLLLYLLPDLIGLLCTLGAYGKGSLQPPSFIIQQEQKSAVEPDCVSRRHAVENCAKRGFQVIGTLDEAENFKHKPHTAISPLEMVNPRPQAADAI